MTKLQAKIEEMKAAKMAETAKLEEAYAENDEYVGLLVDVEIEKEYITKLDKIITTLNAIKPIITNDGTSYRVQVYPVAENTFGFVTARVLAIIRAAGAMFTDERQREFKALTGVDHILASKAMHSIGNPVYFSKGSVSDAVPYQGYDLKVQAVFQALGVPASISTVNNTNLNKWFSNEELKAERKLEAFNKEAKLDSSEFTLED